MEREPEAVCVVKYQGNTIVIPLLTVQVEIHREYERFYEDGKHYIGLRHPFDVTISGMADGYVVMEGEPSDLLRRDQPTNFPPEPKEITNAPEAP